MWRGCATQKGSGRVDVSGREELDGRNLAISCRRSGGGCNLAVGKLGGSGSDGAIGVGTTRAARRSRTSGVAIGGDWSGGTRLCPVLMLLLLLLLKESWVHAPRHSAVGIRKG